jgi:serpin B
MHGEQGSYATGTGWQAVRVRLYGGQLSVVLILPDAGRFDEVERGLGPDLLAQARQPQPGGPAVRLSLPKFKIDTSLELSSALQQLGAVDAFRNANFDGISKGAGLFISVVAHKTYVGVDENGIEAAAATGVGMATSAPLEVVDVRFDRPFLLAVVDEPTGAPLFMGKIVDPSG